jgi:hypothetical protein
MDLRKTFTFDATHHIVRWKGRTVLKAELGEIPFDHIADSGTEATRAGNRDVPVYRLPIITPRATIPMGCDGAVNATTTANLSTPLRSR